VLPSLVPREANHAREMADTKAGRVRLATDIREALFKSDGPPLRRGGCGAGPSIEIRIVTRPRGLEKTVL